MKNRRLDTQPENIAEWLSKTQVADKLGTAEKTVERMAKRGQIRMAYRRRSNARPEPDCSPEDVDRLAAEILPPAHPSTQEVALTTEPPKWVEMLATLIAEQRAEREHLSGAVDALRLALLPAPDEKPEHSSEEAPPSVHVGDKLLLSLKECQMLTGLSRQALLDAKDANKLKMTKLAGKWRIRRSDLDAYLAEL